MRLLHITTVPMSLTFLRGQTGFMKRGGLEVQALSSPGQELDEFGQLEGVETTGVDMARPISPARDLFALVRLVREMRRIRPTIVHSHTPKGGLLGMIAAAIHRAPLRIYHMRGPLFLRTTGLKRWLLGSTDWLACRLAHQVFCVSHSVRAEAIDARICPPDKIKVLLGGSGNGVDASGRFDPDKHQRTGEAVRIGFGIPLDATVIGFVGRIVRDKGVVELADAWRSIREQFPHAHLLLVGPLEAEDPIPVETARQLREDPRVHFAGLEWNTPPLYAAMDIVALPTYREGFPNVPLEAAAMRLPVIATRIPGCVDAIVDGETGLLVPARDELALRTALRQYLERPELRLAHGIAGRARVLSEFRQEAIWDALYSEYQRLLRERVGATGECSQFQASQRQKVTPAEGM